MGKGNFMNNYFQRMSVLLVTAFLNHLSQRPWAQTKNLAPLNILIYRNQSRIWRRTWTNIKGWVQDNFKDKPPPSIIDGQIAAKEGMHRVSSSYYLLNCS